MSKKSQQLLETTFEKIGGLEEAKRVFTSLGVYQEIVNQTRLYRRGSKVFETTYGARGAVCGIPSENGFEFARFTGICHASSRIDLDDFPLEKQVAIFTFPLVIDCDGYEKGFLEGYYNWLSTESVFKDVFLEPFNGEFFCVDLFAPICKVVGALILTRLPVEVYSYKDIWQKARANDFSWWETVLFIHGISTHAGLPMISLSGMGAHCAVPTTYLQAKKLPSLIEGEFTITKSNNDYHLPWNNPVAVRGGVWRSFNEGKDLPSLEIALPWKELHNEVRKSQGWKSRTSGWGSVEWFMATPFPSKEEAIEDLFKCLRSFFDSYSSKGEKENASA